MKKREFLVLATVAFLGLGAAQTASADVVISNVNKTFNPVTCEITFTWDTNVATDSNCVKWERTSCQMNPTFPNVDCEGAGSGTSHSVTFSVYPPSTPKISFIIESSCSSGSDATTCAHALVSPCIDE